MRFQRPMSARPRIFFDPGSFLTVPAERDDAGVLLGAGERRKTEADSGGECEASGSVAAHGSQRFMRSRPLECGSRLSGRGGFAEYTRQPGGVLARAWIHPRFAPIHGADQTADAERFRRLIQPFVASHEAEHGLIYGIAGTSAPPADAYCAAVIDGDVVVAAVAASHDRQDGAVT